METQAVRKFIQGEFSYNGDQYAVVLTPDLYPDGDGLDFTGSFTGLLVANTKGSCAFQLEPGLKTSWDMHLLRPSASGLFEQASVVPSIEGINDPGLIDELDKIITKWINGSK